MATNPYFDFFRDQNEQGLYDDLTVEIIQNYGYDIYYLPRVAVRTDDLFGEDILARYPSAFPIEVYIENVNGFGGEGDIFSKFGLQVRDTITFTMSRRRWDEMQTSRLSDEMGRTIVDESANTSGPGPYTPAMLDEANNAYTIGSRPYEDDLIYFPLVGKLFEIRHVEHEAMFYPLGRRTIYQLRCELYEASSERIDTGIPEIDAIEDHFSLDAKNFEMLDESGDRLLGEDGGAILDEAIVPETSEPQANNSLIQTTAETVVDFGEFNPLSGKRTF